MCSPKRDLDGLEYKVFARNTLSETKHSKFTPLNETTSIPFCFIWESPPPGSSLDLSLPTSIFLKDAAIDFSPTTFYAITT